MRVSCGTQDTFSETWELKGLSSNIHLSGYVHIFKRTRSSETRKRCSFVREFCFGSGIPRDQFQFTFSWSAENMTGKKRWVERVYWRNHIDLSACLCNSRQSLRASWKLKFCPYWSRFILIQVQSLNYCHLALGSPEVELPKNWIIWQPVAS